MWLLKTYALKGCSANFNGAVQNCSFKHSSRVVLFGGSIYAGVVLSSFAHSSYFILDTSGGNGRVA